MVVQRSTYGQGVANGTPSVQGGLAMNGVRPSQERSRLTRVVSILGALLLVAVWGTLQGETDTLAKIKKSGELRIGTGIYPPYSIQKPDGSLIGIDIELLKKLAEKLGAKPKFIVVGWDTIVAGIHTGKYDMTTALCKSEKRAQVVDYAATSLWEVGQVWAVRADNPKNLRTLDDLNRPEVTIVASVGGYDQIVTQELLPKATLKTIPGLAIPQQVAEVISRRVDGAPLETPVNTTVFKAQYQELRFIPDADHPVRTIPGAWTFTKGDSKFQKYISEFLAEETANGTVAKLNAQYMKPEFINP